MQHIFALVTLLALLPVAPPTQQDQAPKLPPNIVETWHYMAPNSVEDWWKGSELVALVSIVDTEQAMLTTSPGAPYPTPFIRHKARILKVWKDNGKEGDRELTIAYPGGTVVYRGSTIVMENDAVLKVGDKFVAFLSDFPGAQAYSITTTGPAGALILDGSEATAKTTKSTKKLFGGKTLVSTGDVFSRLEALAKTTRKESDR